MKYLEKEAELKGLLESVQDKMTELEEQHIGQLFQEFSNLVDLKSDEAVVMECLGDIEDRLMAIHND